MADRIDTPANEQKKEIERIVKKADHLSNFGTLTSLVSTAAYFIENTFVKKLPKWLSVATLSAVGVGIVSVVTSYYYKLKAGRMALDSSAQNKADVTLLPKAVPLGDIAVPGENRTAMQKWSKEIGSTQDSPPKPGR